MKNKMALWAVAIPFILLCLLIVRAEYHIASGAKWDFEITGYDPRDLLRGHYLEFRISYDWDKKNDTCNNIQSCCLCLTKTDNKVPKVNQTSCEVAKTQCDGFMLSKEQNSLNRFYISERKAKRAEDIVRQARIDNNAYLTLSINKKGEPKIVDLLIGEDPLNELLKRPEVEMQKD